jgi:hypothetical protein
MMPKYDLDAEKKKKVVQVRYFLNSIREDRFQNQKLE